MNCRDKYWKTQDAVHRRTERPVGGCAEDGPHREDPAANACKRSLGHVRKGCFQLKWGFKIPSSNRNTAALGCNKIRSSRSELQIPRSQSQYQGGPAGCLFYALLCCGLRKCGIFGIVTNQLNISIFRWGHCTSSIEQSKWSRRRRISQVPGRRQKLNCHNGGGIEDTSTVVTRGISMPPRDGTIYSLSAIND